VITRDNVSVGLAAVAYFRVVDPVASIIEIENVGAAIGQIAQTTVRNVVGRSPLDRVLADTETLNESIKQILDVTTKRWGCLSSWWSSRTSSRPTACSGPWPGRPRPSGRSAGRSSPPRGALSADKLAEAADVIAAHPIALQLRSLQVLSEIASEHNATITFPAQLLETTKAVSAFVQREADGVRREARLS
jgi:regulator of protease activity HflC (stomatin/prohibitin superfamily)